MRASKIIVLTGATRGLGRSLVPHFAAAGNTVLGCGRSEKHIAELRREFGPPHDFAALDVSYDEAVRRWAERLLKQFGPPDLLINNAAIMVDPAPLWKIPAEAFDRLIDINIKGVANVIRHIVPAMVERKQGVIVNLSSGWGRSTSPEVAPYCASKWAIEGLTRALAQELPQDMAAVPLNPGIIDTDMLRQCWAEGASEYPDATEWAKMAAPFLLRLSAKDNGQPLTVK
ncbi:MAG TPA: SDR family oxidoreductase [Gemmataceae bacterium]|jgi:NAD(P)-dependent dehydrogenase (short-subunit alcohol dehydrogenase family)|nr:SDR family oxidoreductase [Gemmataceae bacterium]